MSRRGNCHDNAFMESFFSSLKSELADRFESCGEAKMELFDYIEVFYNQRRRHSTIGYLSPAAFERRGHRRGVPLDGALVGRLAPAPSFLAHADDRLDGVL
jgi:transposase InsO family protein